MLDRPVQVPAVLDAGQCDLVCDLAAERGLRDAAVSTDHGEVRVDRVYRRARQAVLPRGQRTAWLYERLQDALERCNQESFGFDLRALEEPVHVVEYREGDFFEWHYDLAARHPTRKLVASVMLSAPRDYEGGALALPGAEFPAVPRGGAVVFPSFMLHGVRPVKGGRRRALVAIATGPRFR